MNVIILRWEVRWEVFHLLIEHMHSVEICEIFLSLDFSKIESNFGNLAMSKIAILTALEALNLPRLISRKIWNVRKIFRNFTLWNIRLFLLNVQLQKLSLCYPPHLIRHWPQSYRGHLIGDGTLVSIFQVRRPHWSEIQNNFLENTETLKKNRKKDHF